MVATQPPVMWLHFYARWMTTIRCARSDHIVCGLRLDLERGDIPYGQDDTDLDLEITEDRLAAALYSTVNSRLPLFTVVLLNSGRDMGTELSQEMKPRACRAGSLTAVGVFMLLVSDFLASVAQQWTSTLDEVDRTLALDVSCALRAPG